MKDGRENNGGRRAGAGRKTKAVEDDLLRRLKRACKEGRKDRLDELFAKLFEDCLSPSFRTRHAAMKLFLAYYYGKPVERHELTGENGGPIETVGMTLEDWKKRAGERAAQAEEAMADFEGDDA